MYESVYVSPETKARITEIRKAKGSKKTADTVEFLVNVYESQEKILKPIMEFPPDATVKVPDNLRVTNVIVRKV